MSKVNNFYKTLSKGRITKTAARTVRSTGLSKCCNAEVIVVGGDEGTMHWECLKCGEACNIL